MRARFHRHAAPWHGAKDLVHSTLGRGHAAFENDVSFFIQNAVTAHSNPIAGCGKTVETSYALMF
jgi:hypothetical protein